MRMAYFPILENALRSAAMPKMSENRFFGFRMISSIDLIWFQPGNDDREILVAISLANIIDVLILIERFVTKYNNNLNSQGIKNCFILQLLCILLS